MTWASPAIARSRSIRATPTQEPSPIETSSSSAAAETASSPIRTTFTAGLLPGPEAEPAEQLGDAAGGRQQQEREAADGTLDLEHGVEHERQVELAGGRAEDRGDDRAEHVVEHVRRLRLEREAGHLRKRADGGGAEDVADLAERRVAQLAARLDAEQLAETGRAGIREQQQHDDLGVPADLHHDARDHRVGFADGVERVGERQRKRAGDRKLDRAPEHLCERGGRGAGADRRELSQRVELLLVVVDVHAGTPSGWPGEGAARQSQSTTSAIPPSGRTAPPAAAAR